jgi:WD40 repeat protein
MKYLIKLSLLVFILSACGPLIPISSEPTALPGIREYQDFAYDIVWSQDDSMIALTTLTGLYIYNADTYEQLFAFSESGGWGAVFGENYVAAVGNDGLSVWDLNGFKSLFHIAPDDPVQFQSIAISPDDTVLVTGEKDQLRVWSLPDGELIAKIPIEGWASDVKFRSDERLIVANTYLGNVEEWNVPDAKKIREFYFQKPVINLRFSQDAKLVLVDYGISGFELWNIGKGEIQHGYGDIVSASGWQRLSGNNRYAVVWGYAFDGQNSGMSIWDLDVHTQLREFVTPFFNGDGWRCGSLNSNGSILAASNNEGSIIFFDAQSGDRKGEIYLPYKYVVEKG